MNTFKTSHKKFAFTFQTFFDIVCVCQFFRFFASLKLTARTGDRLDTGHVDTRQGRGGACIIWRNIKWGNKKLDIIFVLPQFGLFTYLD